jgi:hypothetical protein
MRQLEMESKKPIMKLKFKNANGKLKKMAKSLALYSRPSHSLRAILAQVQKTVSHLLTEKRAK